MVRGKKIVLIFIVISMLIVTGKLFFYDIINEKNFYAYEAPSVEIAQEEIEKQDFSSSKKIEMNDFYGQYVEDTYFIISQTDRTYYSQGYYMVNRNNLNIVYCIEPFKTVTDIENEENLKDINSHAFSQLSEDSKKNVLQLILISDYLYYLSNDVLFLEAGQLLVWQEASTTLNEYSSNLQPYMDNINKIQKELNAYKINEENFDYYITEGQDVIGLDSNAVSDIYTNEEIKDYILNILSSSPEDSEISADITMDILSSVTDASGDNKVQSSEKLTYKITMKNTSTVDYSNVVIEEVLDEELDETTIENIKINGNDTGYEIKENQMIIEEIKADETINITFEITAQEEFDQSADITSTTEVKEITTELGTNQVDDIRTTATIQKFKEPEEEEITMDILNSVTEASGDDKVQPSEKLTYKITMKNTSTVDYSNVVVEEVLDEELDETTIENIKINGNDTGYEIKENQMIIEEIKADETINITFEITAQEEFDQSADITSTTEVKEITTELGTNQVEDIRTTVTIQKFEEPEEEITMDILSSVTEASGDNKVQPSEKLTYKITMKNTSTVDYSNVVVEEVLDEELDETTIENIKINGNDTGYEIKENQMIIEEIKADETINITFEITAQEEFDQSADIASTTEVKEITTELGTNEIEDIRTTATIQKFKEPEEEITMDILSSVTEASGDDKVQPSEKLTYKITMKNTSTVDYSNVVVEEVLDEELDETTIENIKINGNDTGYEIKENQMIIEEIKADETINITFEITAQEEFDQSADIASTTEVKEITTELGTNEVEDIRTTATIQKFKEPEEEITMDILSSVTEASGDDKVQPSEKLTYKITMKNTSTVDYSNVVVEEVLDEELDETTIENIKINGNDTGYEIKENQMIIEEIKADETINITFEITAQEEFDQSADITSTIEVKEITTELGTNQVEDIKTTVVISKEDDIPSDIVNVEFSKHVTDSNDNMVEPGEEIHYKYTISNEGDKEYKKIYIRDLLDNQDLDKSSISNFRVYNQDKISLDYVGDIISGITIEELPANSDIIIEFNIKVNDFFTAEEYIDSTAMLVIEQNNTNEKTMIENEKDIEKDMNIYPSDVNIDFIKKVSNSQSLNLYNKVSPTEPLYYKYTITNNSTKPVIALNLYDDLSKEDTDIAPGIYNLKVNNKTVENISSDDSLHIDLNTLNVGETLEITFEAKASEVFDSSEEINTTAVIEADNFKDFRIEENDTDNDFLTNNTADIYKNINSDKDYSTIDTMFLVPQLIKNYTQEEMDYTFLKAKDVGINNIVIQYSLEYYNDKYVVEHYMDGGVIDKALNSASKYNINIYFGTQIADDLWFEEYEDVEFLKKQENISVSVIDQIYNKYYSEYKDIFKGYYLTFEINNIDFVDDVMEKMITNYYLPVSEHIKNLNSKFDIMISPLIYAPDYSETEQQIAEEKWNQSIEKILTETEINIFAPQDCLGNGVATLQEISVWFESMEEVFTAYNKNNEEKYYWVNNENYDMNGTGYMDLNTFIEDMNSLAKYTTNNISFSIHRLLPKNNQDYTNKYYNAYKYYWEKGQSEQIPQVNTPFSINKEENSNNIEITIDNSLYSSVDSSVAKYSLYANDKLIGEQKSDEDVIYFSTLKRYNTKYELKYKDPYGYSYSLYSFTTELSEENQQIDYDITLPLASNNTISNILNDDYIGSASEWTENTKWYILPNNKTNEVIINLDTLTKVEKLNLYMLEERNTGIYLPDSIEVYVSSDGQDYEKIDTIPLEFYAYNEAEVYELNINIGRDVKSIKLKLNVNNNKVSTAITEVDLLN